MPALELTLPQIASPEADGTIAFHANRISTIASAPQAFMIFYLTQADEQNGYGTVIQLDEQKKAFIYPDLNPEYTYLFFQNEQGFQTLLWCIEFATRTPDGLYVTQAKTHGRGVTEEDMQRFGQIALPGNPPASQPTPQPQHALAEEYTPTAPSAPAPTLQVQPAIPANLQMPVEPAAQTSAMPAQSSPVFEPASPANMATLPNISEYTAGDANIAPLPNLPPLLSTPDANLESPTLTEAPPYSSTQPAFTAPLPDLAPLSASPTSESASADVTMGAPAFEPTLDLPPLPSLPASPVGGPAESSLVAPTETLAPQQPAAPVYQSPEPTLEAAMPPQPASNTIPDEPAVKNPVGRPPKPLMTDTSWQVDQADFGWAKNISRESISTFQPELRQKVEQQIQRHQPQLLADPVFVDSFNHAFNAVCQTYELVPTARQDLLRSLLNGRIVENVLKTLPQG